MKFWKIVLTTVFALALFGCANKYTAPRDFSYQVTGLTKAQVQSAILDAGRADRGWALKAINDSTIQGSLFNRGYEAKVNIAYSASGYTISYVSASDNLKDRHGNVHRNYNRWVNNLDQDIRHNINIESSK